MPPRKIPDVLPRGIHETPKGSGVYSIQYFDKGQRKRETCGSYGQAVDTLLSRRAAILEGRKVPDYRKQELTVADLVERYQHEIEKKKDAANDLRMLRQCWLPEIGSMLIDKLTPGDIERCKSRWSRGEKKIGPATLNRRSAVLRRLYSRAFRDGLVETNPLTSGRVASEREPDSPDKILELADQVRLLADLAPLDAAAVRILLFTGLRISELVEREKGDVDRGRALLAIPEAKGKGRQRVSLPAPALEAVEQLLAASSTRWLMPNESGEDHLSRFVLAARLKRSCVKLGIVGVSPHTFRHTFVSRLVMLGVPIVTVQRLARHKSLSMTLKYAHLAPDHQADALTKLVTEYSKEDS